MVTSGLVSLGKAGEVLQVRDRSGRDWCGRQGEFSRGDQRHDRGRLGKFIYGGVRRSVLRRGRSGEVSYVLVV